MGNSKALVPDRSFFARIVLSVTFCARHSPLLYFRFSHQEPQKLDILESYYRARLKLTLLSLSLSLFLLQCSVWWLATDASGASHVVLGDSKGTNGSRVITKKASTNTSNTGGFSRFCFRQGVCRWTGCYSHCFSSFAPIKTRREKRRRRRFDSRKVCWVLASPSGLSLVHGISRIVS